MIDDPEFMASWNSTDGQKLFVPQNDLKAASQLGWGLNEHGIASIKKLAVGESLTFTPGGMNPITVLRLRKSNAN